MGLTEYEQKVKEIKEKQAKIAELNLTTTQLFEIKRAAESLLTAEYRDFRYYASPADIERLRKLSPMGISAYHHALNYLQRTLGPAYSDSDDPDLIFSAAMSLLIDSEMKVPVAESLQQTR